MKTRNFYFFLVLFIWIHYQSFSQWSNLTTNTSEFLFGEYFLNNDTGFVFGNTVVLKTTDGGTNWSSPSLAILSQFTAMNFINDNIGYLVGDGGSILKTIDGGNNWFAQNSPANQLLYAVDFIDSLQGVAVGEYATIIKTFDGGQTWAQIPSPYLFGDSLFHYELRTIQFINDSTAYAAGGPSGGTTCIFIKTADGGNTWNIIYESYDFPVFLQIEFINDTLGFASGSCHNNNPFCYRSKILKTMDGGNSWADVYFDWCDELRSIDIVGDFIYSVGYYWGGYNPIIIYSSDFGLNWNYQNALNLSYPYQVFFTDSLTGYIVGDSGKVLKTTNGGVGFNEITPIPQSINIFPNPVKGYCTIKVPGFLNASLLIYDVTGRAVMMQQAFNTQTQINASSLTQGIYLAEVKDVNGRSVKGKLLKE